MTQPFVTTDEILTEFFNALARTRGSHRLYRHADGRRVTVSAIEMSDTFPPAIRKSMLETQAQWSNQDLKRLGIGP